MNYKEYFDKHKQTMTGVFAGEYLDREDFEWFGCAQQAEINILNRELAAKDKEIERLKALLQKSIVENALSRLEGPNAAIIAAKTWENFKTEHNL